MAVRRSIDHLVQRFAEIRGVEPDQAVRIAVTEALEREQQGVEDPEEKESQAAIIEEIDAMRLAIAESSGEDQAAGKLWRDVWPPVVSIMFLILCDSFMDKPLQASLIAIILICFVLLCFYWNSLIKQSKTRKEFRKSLTLGIEELAKELPYELRFLANSAGENPQMNWIIHVMNKQK